MHQGRRIAVVVPAYNESKHILRCLDTIPAFVDRVLVVDDASTDETARLVREFADTRVELLRHSSNRGVGAAIISGYRRAHAAGMDVAVVMAGDGQMDPHDLPDLVQPILEDRADYVKGERLSWPDAHRVIPRLRLAGIQMLQVLTRLSTGLYHLRDFQCGYTALRLSVLDRIELSRVYPRYGFPNDFIAHLALAGARVAETRVRPVYEGQSSDLRIHRVAVPILLVLARSTGRRILSRSV
ncbi:MAG: glycosyltransferase family 2 protein [Myxococcales bacterium]|nr:glycosyltransferase family 2 protein [Myxococcales bacterium]